MDGEEIKQTSRGKPKAKPAELEVVKRRAPLSREDQKMYQSLVDELTEEKMPANPRETALVEDIALNYVRLQRARRLETETMNKHIAEVQGRYPEPIDGGKALAIVFMEHGSKLESMQRKEVKIEDAWYRAIDDLDREQTARRALGNAAPPAADPKSNRIHLVRHQRPS